MSDTTGSESEWSSDATISDDYPSDDPDYVDDAFMHGPLLPGDIIHDIPQEIITKLGVGLKSGNRIAICNAITPFGTKDHVERTRPCMFSIAHSSRRPEIGLDVETFEVKVCNDFVDQVVHLPMDQWSWDLVKTNLYLQREHQYAKGRKIDSSNFHGTQEWIDRAIEIINQETSDNQRNHHWIYPIPRIVRESLGTYPAPFACLSIASIRDRETVPEPNWWANQLMKVRQKYTTISETTITKDIPLESDSLDLLQWRVVYINMWDKDNTAHYKLYVHSTEQGLVERWVNRVKVIENTLPPELIQKNTQLVVDREKYQLRKELANIGPHLPDDTLETIPSWMKHLLGDNPEPGSIISVLGGIRSDPTWSSCDNYIDWIDYHNYAEMKDNPYTTNRKHTIEICPHMILPENNLDYERVILAPQDSFIEELDQTRRVPGGKWSWKLVKENFLLYREDSYEEGRQLENNPFSLNEWVDYAKDRWQLQMKELPFYGFDPKTLEPWGVNARLHPVPSELKEKLGKHPAPGTHISLRNYHVSNKDTLRQWMGELTHSGHKFSTTNQDPIVLLHENESHHTCFTQVESLSLIVTYGPPESNTRKWPDYHLTVREMYENEESKDILDTWVTKAKMSLATQ